MKNLHLLSLASCVAVATATFTSISTKAETVTAPAYAEFRLNMPAQPLGTALGMLGSSTRTNIAFDPGTVAGFNAPALNGSYSLADALNALLQPSGLTAEKLGENSFVIISQKTAKPARKTAFHTKQADPAISTRLDEIVVTANKRSESISKVGMTIKALSAATLQQEHVTSLADLAKAVPGLTYTPSEEGAPVYTLRGVGFYDTALSAYPDVSIYLDQAPLPFSAETVLTLFDIQRIEVLEGPQGTLFGNNATGGAINYIANKPTSNFDAGADVSYGNYNTLQADGFVSGPLTPKLLGRFAFNATEGDGWQHSMTRDDVSGKQDKAAVRVILDWAPTDDLHVEWNVNGWHDASQPQQSQWVKYRPDFPSFSPLINAPIGPNNDTAADWPAAFEPRSDNSLFQSTLRADYDLTDTIKLTSITDFIHYQQNERPDSDGTQFLAPTQTASTGFANDFSQELRVSGGGAGPFRWLGGLNYAYDTVWERDTGTFNQNTAGTYPPFGTTIGSTFDSKQDMENYAVFANGEYDIFHQFTLKGGVRFTQANRSDNSCGAYTRGTNLDFPDGIAQFLGGVSAELSGSPFTPVAIGQCTLLAPATSAHPFALSRFYDKLDEDNVSYHGGVDWKPTGNILAFANISRGYKAGSFPTIAGSVDASQAPVKQESVTDYEIGVKTQLFDRHLSINATGFYYDYNNKQLKSRLIDPIFGILDALVNIPQSSVRGAQLEIHGRPMLGLDIGAEATYLDASIDSFTGVNQAGLVQNFAGAAVPYTPRWQLAGNIGYKHPINDRLAGFAGAQVNYRSSTTASVGSPPLYGLPGYTTLDLQAGIQTSDDKWRVFLWGKNVTNQFYLTNVVEVSDGLIRFTGLPATYGVTVSYRY